MRSKRMRIILGLLTMCFVALLSANAQGDKAKVKGLITTRTGERPAPGGQKTAASK
jgi:hypothetical protein